MAKEKHKTCNDCGRRRALSMFYRKSRLPDGHVGTCKDCTLAQQKAYRRANIEKLRAYDRKRDQGAKRRAEKQANLVRHNERHPQRRRARKAVANGVRRGTLERQPCEVCGTTKRIHGHHDDYSQPLAVRWLCREHHRQVHATRA